MTNNLKAPKRGDANEQMREKAAQINISYGCWDNPGNKDAQRLIDVIAEALQEAHAAGRQEILDRLPSDIEIAEAYDAKRAAVGGRGNTIHMMAGWIEAYREIKSRLTGES